MQLRPYQTEAMLNVFSEWDKGVRKTLLVLPTGCGKTIVFSKIIEELVKQGKRVLVLAHRGELLEQASDKLLKATGIGSALEKAESSAKDSWFRVTVGSVQTLQREKRLKQYDKNYYDVIVIDEAHHAVSNGYTQILDYFDESKVLGVTATADRADKKNLGTVFETLAYQYTIIKAIKEGYLSPIKALTIPLTLDLSSVSMSAAGDFKASEVSSALDPYLEQIADEMKKHCLNRKTVVFLPLVSTSKKFRDILIKKGFKAAEVNGESEDRSEILKDFDNGKYNVLCNSMLLTEGWDCPSVDCVIVLRPTKSRGLYTQMVGRGTRLAPNKQDLLLLDFLWHVEKHELCRPAYLVSDSPEVTKKMTERLEEVTDMAFDILDELESSEKEVIKDREESLKKELEKMRKKKRALVDPLQFEMSIDAEDLTGYVPSFGWEMQPASKKQIDTLEKFGIFAEEVSNAGRAALLLDRLNKRQNEGLCRPKQIRLLERYGFKKVGLWTFDNASNMISRIAANGWRVPRGVNPSEYIPE